MTPEFWQDFFARFGIDLSETWALMQTNPVQGGVRFLFMDGFIVLLLIQLIPWFIQFVWRTWLISRWNKFAPNYQYTLLALKVPRAHEQSFKAIEQIFNQIHGLQKNPNIKEMYWDGYFDANISLEMVSNGGAIQYFVRVPNHARDLIESAFYAQYPDMEIVEVEDYVDYIPTEWPQENYKLWGADLLLGKESFIPIKTHHYFEHQTLQKVIDPAAALLEILSKMNQDEQVFIQLVIVPMNPGPWVAEGKKFVDKLIGKKVKEEKTDLFDKIRRVPWHLVGEGVRQILGEDVLNPGDGSDDKEDKGPENRMAFFTPDEHLLLENVQRKLAQNPFKCKMRFLYLGKKESFNKAKGVAGIMGAYKQFGTNVLNMLVPDKRTKVGADYFFIEQTENKLRRLVSKLYKGRAMSVVESDYADDNMYMVLVPDEIATLFHFPDVNVNIANVQSADLKTGEAPLEVPANFADTIQPITAEVPTEITSADEAPANLPVEEIDEELG